MWPVTAFRQFVEQIRFTQRTKQFVGDVVLDLQRRRDDRRIDVGARMGSDNVIRVPDLLGKILVDQIEKRVAARSRRRRAWASGSVLWTGNRPAWPRTIDWAS
jgi:hypothetical protein